jgi:hypothetical protein
MTNDTSSQEPVNPYFTLARTLVDRAEEIPTAPYIMEVKVALFEKLSGGVSHWSKERINLVNWHLHDDGFILVKYDRETYWLIRTGGQPKGIIS